MIWCVVGHGAALALLPHTAVTPRQGSPDDCFIFLARVRAWGWVGGPCLDRRRCDSEERRFRCWFSVVPVPCVPLTASCTARSACVCLSWAVAAARRHCVLLWFCTRACRHDAGVSWYIVRCGVNACCWFFLLLVLLCLLVQKTNAPLGTVAYMGDSAMCTIPDTNTQQDWQITNCTAPEMTASRVNMSVYCADNTGAGMLHASAGGFATPSPTLSCRFRRVSSTPMHSKRHVYVVSPMVLCCCPW